MKPKFLEVIKLGVLVGFIGLALAVIIHGPSDTQQVVQSVSGNGVAGFYTIWLLAKWMVFGFICVMFAVVACLVLNALGVLTTILQRIGGGLIGLVASLRAAWVGPPVQLSTLVGKRTLGEVLQMFGSNFKELNSRLNEVETKTAGIEPPPPPKTPEQIIAELQAKLAEAENRKTINQPVAPAVATSPAEAE